jgi:ABC-type multidrug transport system fused ATPase/permease subunit
MDNGVIAEYDSPSALLANETSKFRAMINETGATNAEFLVESANKGR